MKNNMGHLSFILMSLKCTMNAYIRRESVEGVVQHKLYNSCQCI